MDLKESVKTQFGLEDYQVDVLFEKYDKLVIAQAFDKTKSASRDIFKMNLKIVSKYYKDV